MRLPRIAWLVPVALFFLNPALACGGDEPEFQYGAAEMRAAVEGTWVLTVSLSGGASQTLTVAIEQDTKSPAQASHLRARGLLRAAQACGTRSLVKSAGACVDLSQMPLKVTMVSGDAAFQGAALSGMFTVYGLAFSQGEVNLAIADARVFFTLSADGVPSRPSFSSASQGTVSVARQPTR